MNLNIIKDFIRKNCIFDCSDSPSGVLDITDRDMHNIEFGGSSAFFPEGGSPPLMTSVTRTVALDIYPVNLPGANEVQIAENYLRFFYYKLLDTLVENQALLQLGSISSASDFDTLFGNLNQIGGDGVAIVTTVVDFSGLLNAQVADSRLGLILGVNDKFLVRDHLSSGASIVKMVGPRKKKVIAVDRSAIVLNLPQALSLVSLGSYQTELQFKVIYPDQVLVHGCS